MTIKGHSVRTLKESKPRKVLEAIDRELGSASDDVDTYAFEYVSESGRLKKEAPTASSGDIVSFACAPISLHEHGVRGVNVGTHDVAVRQRMFH